MRLIYFTLFFFLFLSTNLLKAQNNTNSALLSIDRIYIGEFQQQYEKPIQWIERGNAYIIVEPSTTKPGANQLTRYDSDTQRSSVFISGETLVYKNQPLKVEAFQLSYDRSKVLIFTNSSRVWRTNTKGDYYLVDLLDKSVIKLGKSLPSSSLMFAKIASNNAFVTYVSNFNIYKEDLQSGTITQLTQDGGNGLINGTFDWAYEEEFDKKDGFSVSPDNKKIAFYHSDASKTGTFYMINNTDSIYAKPIPIQYPKVGQAPSVVKLGIIDLATNMTEWIPVPKASDTEYIPGMQWVDKDLVLIQQLNRHQNELNIYTYQPSTREIKKVYTEKEDTWIELKYPDIAANRSGGNDLLLSKDRTAFYRLTENGKWRNIRKVDIATGKIKDVTPFNFDVLTIAGAYDDLLYFIASPEHTGQRYLYQSRSDKPGKSLKKLTPEDFTGVNTYNISPNGKYAIHVHQDALSPRTVHFVSLPDHKVIRTLVDNKVYQEKFSQLALPKVEFSTVTTSEDISIPVRTIFPPSFDAYKKYPVLFHVYGEPWGQVATDTQIGLWNILMAQKGYVIIDMDNRGTPVPNGSNWRKSIYRKVGVVNAKDQGLAAKEILKKPYLDENRVAIWGWSGGGSMTLNLLFQFPEVYQTGVAVAAVTDQRIYDNIYQERYMGLLQENPEDFVKGSPVTYTKNLEGNLLLIHGTADDNVHYQSAEILVNELIKQNKQFDMMSYPNRSHGIYEGYNTRRHLYQLITDYILEHTPPNG